MEKKNSSVAVYMKIRRYMLNIVEQAGDRSIQVPSILELSRRFGVSRPTVSKAMKMLTNDGYIIGRPGLGSFTNPAQINRHQVQHYRNVGMLIGDGMMINYSPYYADQVGRMLSGIAQQDLAVTSIMLTTHQKKQVVEEISMVSADILLWLMPPAEMLDVIHELRTAGKRLIVVGPNGSDSVDAYFDYETFGYQMGQKLLAAGCRKVVYLLDMPAWNKPLSGMKRAFHEVGLTPDPDLLIPETSGMWEKLEELLASPGKVDAVFGAVCPARIFMPLYRRIPQAVRQRVFFILEADSSSPNEFSGILFRASYQKLADGVCALISRELQGENTPPKPLRIAIEFSEQKTGEMSFRRNTSPS